jgi:hypothetical protein
LLKTAGLRDSEKTEIVGGASLAERAGDLPLDSQVPKCSFRSVVVPRDTVVLNEREKRFLIALKSLPVSRGRISRGNLSGDCLSVKTLYSMSMFAEVAGFKAIPVDVFENRTQQVAHSHDKPLKFIIKWIFPKIIVQVSDEMYKAFLLPARKRVVSSIKIRDDGTLEIGKQRFQKLCFAVWPQPKDHVRVVSKNPDVLVCT